MGGQYDVGAANALFLPAWNEAARNARKPTKSKQEEGMALFRKALHDCDKAMEKMVDAHQKSVAESAKKLAAYHKRRAQQEQFRKAAAERHLINEQVRIESINHQNMLESIRIEELNREALLRQKT